MKRIALLLAFLPSLAFAQTPPKDITVTLTVPEAQAVFGALKSQVDPINMMLQKLTEAANPKPAPAPATPAPAAAQAVAPATNDATQKDK